MAQALPRIDPSTPRLSPPARSTPGLAGDVCRVCGCTEVVTDEVVDRGILLLAECPRCDHRWTEQRALATPVVRGLPEVRVAA
jgi:hypothetical protein